MPWPLCGLVTDPLFVFSLQTRGLRKPWWTCGRWPIRPSARNCPKRSSCPASSPSTRARPLRFPGSSGPRFGVREAQTVCRRSSRSWWPGTTWWRSGRLSAALGFVGFVPFLIFFAPQVKKAFQGRVTLPGYSANRYNASLALSGLRSSDSGLYRCEIVVGINDEQDTVPLEVTGKYSANNTLLCM